MTKLKRLSITVWVIIIALLPGTMIAIFLLSLIHQKSRRKIFQQILYMKGAIMNNTHKITKIFGRKTENDARLAEKVDPSQIDADRLYCINEAFAYIEAKYEKRASGAWGVSAIIFSFMIGATMISVLWFVSQHFKVG